MAKTYKVWVDVEEHDEETDEYQDLDLPFGSVATFDTLEEAEAFAKTLNDIGEEL